MPGFRSFSFVAFLLATPAMAQQNESLTTPDVVVTGIRVTDAEKALADCIARHCPPNEEIAATLALANLQFKAGNYQAARTALLKARARNARFAKQYPVAVANLHHANAVVAGNMGLATSEFSSTLDAISAMKAGLPENDPRVFEERMELADTYTRLGRITGAENEYTKIARQAHDLGLFAIEGRALLELATLEARLATRQPELYTRVADQAIDRATSLTDPAAADSVRTAGYLRAQLAAINGQNDEFEKLVAGYSPLPKGTPPVLLSAPLTTPQHQSGRETDSGYDPSTGAAHDNSASRIAMENFEGQWADINFRVGQDGRVSDVQVMRQGKRVEGDWVDQIIKSVSGRRYVPQQVTSRVQERYTYTSNFVQRTGSRILARDPAARLERTAL